MKNTQETRDNFLIAAAHICGLVSGYETLHHVGMRFLVATSVLGATAVLADQCFHDGNGKSAFPAIIKDVSWKDVFLGFTGLIGLASWGVGFLCFHLTEKVVDRMADYLESRNNRPLAAPLTKPQATAPSP